MAKFGINDILDVKNMASGEGKVNEYKEIWLSPYEVKPSEGNFYSQDKMEELADSFLAVGQQQRERCSNRTPGYNHREGRRDYRKGKMRSLRSDVIPVRKEVKGQ